ncbi:hypothetical protein PACILC2_22270 [Paenibacillus cisolokensis]|uniref:Uncharacterized protein n=1 Tax=Paenibacillus cisolokensis TaxID=1658519 RepID=A0ABQ4N688_9BACL|nr:hypothetical protein [Paenibacillus cisolokensis]GIQ63659.1 hypothetical protein PACILC2_22270 [Paenibacillus cisolokensis]
MSANKRSVNVGINVKSPATLPRLGRQLNEFFRAIEEYVGPADVSVMVAVNPAPDGAVGPVKFVVITPDYDEDDEGEGEIYGTH